MQGRQWLWLYTLATSVAFVLTGCAGCDGENNGTSTQCESNADCSATETCNQSTGLCVPRGQTQSCTSDVACQFDEYCADGTCAPSACAGDEECAAGAICDTGFCRAGCRENGDCSDDQVCNMTVNRCEAPGCLSTGCVANIETCSMEGDVPTCIPSGKCANDGHCASYANYVQDGEDYICDTARQECTVKPPCMSDNDCTIGDICEVRDGGRNRCRPGCRDDSSCATGEFCDVEGAYVPVGSTYENAICIRGCTADMDCNDLLNDPTGDYACIDLLCISKCEGLDDCMAGQICTGQPSTCQGCTDDNQCPATQFCDFTMGYNDMDKANPALGLCTNLPPDCPDEGYGKNTSLASAFPIDMFPFIADGTMMEAPQPFYCSENNAQGDWFVVSALPGKVITVTVEYENMGANLDVAIKNSTGADLVTSSRPPTTDGGMESVTYGVELGDDYYIQVRGSVTQKKLPYTLKVDVSDPPPCRDDQLEENDESTSPAVLTAAMDYTMLQVCGTDRDFYQLDVKANQVVKIETIAPFRAGDIDLFVTTPAGAPVASASTSQDNETLIFATEGEATYILEVVVAGGIGNIDYDLRWTQRDNECSDVFDQGNGNNSCGDATPLPFAPGADPGTQVYASTESLRVCTDSDWYEVTLLPLQKLELTATYNARQSAGFIDFRLRGPGDCATIAAYDTRERDAANNNIVRQKLSYTATNGGTFYIAATIAQGLNVTYDLEVKISDGPACVEDSYEENDTLATAHVIDRANALTGAENAYIGLRFCDLDDDYYSIDLEAGDTIEWVVKHKVAGGKDLDASIYLPDGSNPVSGTSTTDDETVTYTATVAGTYTLRVYGKAPVRTDYRLLTYITPSGGTKVGPLDPDCPDRFENNDTQMTAASVDPGSYDLLVCGQTPSGVDDDWYRTLVAPGETLTVKLDLVHANGNIDLFLYEDSSFSIPVQRSQTINNVEQVSFTSQREQYLYYKVNTYSSVPSNTYTMTVTRTPAPSCVDDDSEQNDTAAAAASLTAPGLYDRRFKCEDDQDWYKFQVTENQKAEVYALFQGSANIDLFVYSDAGTTLVQSGTTTTATNESVVFTAPDDPSTAAGATQTLYTYWVKVETKTRARMAYDLLLYRDLNNDGTFGPGEGNPDRACPDRFENNDTRTTAATLAAGSYDDARLCWRGGVNNDEDYYAIFVPNGATLDVTLTFTHAAGDVQLAILSSTGAQVAFSTSNTDNESASITNTTGSGANYYVRVYGSGTGYDTFYDLDLALSFSGACPEDSVGEPTRADATTNTPVGNYPNLALCEGTEDWFRLNVNGNRRVLANVELNNRFGNIDIELVDSSGAVIATSATDTNLETIDTVVPSVGTYYLRVFSRNGVFIRNLYDLWLSIAGSDPAAPFCPDSYERNDDVQSAATLPFSTQKLYDDMIACGADADWYSVSGLTSGAHDLKVFFDAASGVNLDLTVKDDTGATVTTKATSGNDEFLTFTAAANRTYFLGVENTASNAVEAPYVLYVNRVGGTCPEDAYEPNNTPAQVKALPGPGLYALASCSGTGNAQDDYFTYTAASSGPVTFTVRHDESVVDFLVEIRDPLSTTHTATNGTNRYTYTYPAAVAGQSFRIYIGSADPSKSTPYVLEIEE